MADDILKTLIAEAYGEGPEAMRLVAETILNRSAIRGLTPEQVVRQPKQYTGLNSPGPAAKKAWQSPEALAAAEAAWQLAQGADDPTGGADHYYAPGTISKPGWARSMKPTVEAGGHAFFSSRPLPPGELPQVASALSTVPTPRQAPAPVTPSIDMAQMRRAAPPTQLIPDTFAGLSRPARNLGDELAMSPIQGGKQQAPLFDGIYDERVGAIRPSGSPIDTQGVGTFTSKPPAPVPAMMSPHIAGRRATDPATQAALNARYPAQLPPLPPPGIGGAPTTRVVQSLPVPPRQALGFSYAGQDGTPRIPDRLFPAPPIDAASIRGSGPGDFNPYGAQVPAPLDVPPVVPNHSLPTPIQIAQGTGFRGPPATAVATALDVKPMPPMPIPSPRRAPVPFPRPAFGMGGPEGPAAPAPRPGPFGVKLPTMSMMPAFASPAPMLMPAAAQAVNQSGDYSSGNQYEAAALRASGDSWRAAQERKKGN